MIFGLVFALIVAVPPQSSSPESHATMQERAQDAYERHRQTAIRVNGLAGKIHSQADADTIISEIAELFAKELPPIWATSNVRQRVAHAEFEAVNSPARLIPEQRIADVWNQYVREIGAPDEAIVSAAEIHNMRDGSFTTAQFLWAHGHQTIWTMPNVYALGPDDKVADGCRALDAIRVIHDLDGFFQNLRAARERVRKGIVPSDQVKKQVGEPKSLPRAAARLEVHPDPNPMRAAELRYVEEHGSVVYGLLLVRLFDELFPAQ
ncbi:MAG TPA: hypothetical protein VK722_23215 [Candidatus Aquilonibacter sp.]|jgi:hypothetical protein|nr:hypothetical protein [Candidatus Aquilonibacter sp.]